MMFEMLSIIFLNFLGPKISSSLLMTKIVYLRTLVQFLEDAFGVEIIGGDKFVDQEVDLPELFDCLQRDWLFGWERDGEEVVNITENVQRFHCSIIENRETLITQSRPLQSIRMILEKYRPKAFLSSCLFVPYLSALFLS